MVPRPPGCHPIAGLFELVMLSRPHLVLTDLGRDERLPILSQLIEALNRILRLDHLLILLVAKALPRLPAVDFGPPGREFLPIGFEPSCPPTL